MYRTLKIALATCLLLLSIWALLLPPYFPSSSLSVVNAAKVVVESPYDGMIRYSSSDRRRPIKEGDALARVQRDMRGIEKEMEEIRFLESRLKAQYRNVTTLYEKRNSELEAALIHYEKRQKNLVESLTERLQTGQQQVEVYTASAQSLREDSVRIKPLLEQGIITKSKWSEHQQSILAAEEKLRIAENQMLFLSKELNDAEQGLALQTADIDDGLNSQISSLQTDLRKLESESKDLKAQIEQIEKQVESNQEYLETSTSEVLRSPIDGLIWRVRPVNGASVRSGQAIVDLADANACFVEAFFNRHYQENIRLDDHAHILLTQSSRYAVGKVTDIQVVGEDITEDNIIAMESPSADMLRVIIKLEPDTIEATQIGDLAQVVISGGSSGIMKRSLVWLNFLLRRDR